MNAVLRAVICTLSAATVALALSTERPNAASGAVMSQSAPGELLILGADRQPADACPLKHTEVSARISGFVARGVHSTPTPATVECGLAADEAIKATGGSVELTPEQKKQTLIDGRLDRTMKDLPDRYRQSAVSGSYSVPGRLMVKDGKVEVMMWIKDASAQKQDRLEKLGLSDWAWALQDRILIGWIPIARLEELAQLDFVTRIAAPDYSRGE